MKNNWFMMVLALTIASAVVPQKSEAALTIGLINGGGPQTAVIAGGAAAGWIGLGRFVFYPNVDENGWDRAFFNAIFLWPAIGGLILEVDAKGSESEIFEGFKSTFSFVDNVEVFNRLTYRSKEKLRAAVQAQPESSQWSVSFDETEVDEIFYDVDLSDDHRQFVLKTLR